MGCEAVRDADRGCSREIGVLIGRHRLNVVRFAVALAGRDRRGAVGELW